MKKTLRTLLFFSLAISSISLISIPARADTAGGGTVPTDVSTAVKDTTATVQALAPIALAAVSVSLVPFGAGMALSFVHKVMSKA